MSRIETLYLDILSRFGVDPTACDLAADVPRWPDRKGEVDPLLGSPYDCLPTTWGIEEAPAPAEPAKRRSPRPEASRARRPRRRRNLELEPQPAPRGLLLT